MRTMFQMGFNQNMFWMGNGGHGGRSTTWGGEPGPYRYCDPSMEPCPEPLVGPVGFGPSVSLGQATSYDLDKLVKDMNMSSDKMNAVNTWISNRPQYEQVLGIDLGRWNNLTGDALNEATLSVITDLQQRFNSPDKTQWVITPGEYQTLIAWENSVGQLYDITLRHPELTPGGPKVPLPGAKPVPAAAAPAISPLAIGVGAAALIGLIAVAVS